MKNKQTLLAKKALLGPTVEKIEESLVLVTATLNLTTMYFLSMNHKQIKINYNKLNLIVTVTKKQLQI